LRARFNPKRGSNEREIPLDRCPAPAILGVDKEKSMKKIALGSWVAWMVVPPSVWAYKNMGFDAPPEPGDENYEEFVATVEALTYVQNSSHTPQGAFGYVLGQIDPRPRLTVATHFPVADDTVASAFDSVKAHCPDVVMGEDIAWSMDLMVLRVFPDRIDQYRADVSRYAFNPPVQLPAGMMPPKYNDGFGKGDPYYQIDTNAAIPAVSGGVSNYRVDGY
jgi:ribonuclease Z